MRKGLNATELVIVLVAILIISIALIPELMKLCRAQEQLIQEGIENPTHEMISQRIRENNSKRKKLVEKYMDLREEKVVITEFEKDFGRYK